MSRLPSLPDPTDLFDVIKTYPKFAKPYFELSHLIMRGDSPLGAGERELIGAFVSGLNSCDYCFGIHKDVASAFGLEESMIEQLMTDHNKAHISAKMKALLSFVKKLTEAPSRLTDSDASLVLDAGYSEEALHDAIYVCAIFCFTNRIVAGTGVSLGENSMIPSDVARDDDLYLQFYNELELK